MRYPAMPDPPVSVDAFQLRSICVQLAGRADGAAGTDGGVVSAGRVVVLVDVEVDVEVVLGRVLVDELLELEEDVEVDVEVVLGRVLVDELLELEEDVEVDV